MIDKEFQEKFTKALMNIDVPASHVESLICQYVDLLGDDDRERFMKGLLDPYCPHCFCKQGERICQCWNDE